MVFFETYASGIFPQTRYSILFALHRRFIIKRRVYPHGIIVSVDVVGDHPSELKTGPDRLHDDQLLLECREEALHDCVIPTVTLTAHARR